MIRVLPIVALATGMTAAPAHLEISRAIPSMVSTECPVRAIGGRDTTVANYHLPVYLGHVWGQVFRADDVLIRSITVWRRASPYTNLDPMHLYITALDSLGYPDIFSVLLDGPSLVIPIGPTPTSPTEVRYEFDPPFELPAQGSYWFGIKEDWCDYAFDLLADTTGSYPEGAAWRLERLPSCEGVGCCPESFGGGFDLIFEIEFCSTDVQTQTSTWGRTKVRYR